MLGGIGFTWEHDAHLYLRRALALRQLLGGTARWRDRTAAAGAGRDAAPARADGCKLMARARWATSLPPFAPRQESRQPASPALPAAEQRRALADSGLRCTRLAAAVRASGFPGRRLVIDDELDRSRPGQAGHRHRRLGHPGHSRPWHGGPADRFAGPTLRGEITWCQLFSEPEAGSDLASLRTRAERADGGWRSPARRCGPRCARQADWAICLARTDASVPKHKGITYFLVAMDSPGIEIGRCAR